MIVGCILKMPCKLSGVILPIRTLLSAQAACSASSGFFYGIAFSKA